MTSLGTLRCSTTLTTLLRARATRRATACSCRWLFPTPAPTSSCVVWRSTCCRCNSAASSVGLSCWRRPCSWRPPRLRPSPSRRPFAAASPAAAPPPSAAAAAPSPPPRPPKLARAPPRAAAARGGGGRSGRAAAGRRARRRQRGGAHADVLAESCSGMGEAQVPSEAARDSAVPHRDQSATQPCGCRRCRASCGLVSEHQYFRAAELFIKATAWSSMELLAHSVLVVLLPPLSLHFVNHRRYLHWRKAHELVYRSAAEGRLWRSLQTRVWEGHRLELGACSGVRTWVDRHLLSDGGAARAPAGGQAAADVARANHDARAPFDHRLRRRRRRAVSAPHVFEGASAAVSPSSRRSARRPKFGVPDVVAAGGAGAENAAAAIDDARGAAARRRRRRRRRPRQRDDAAADDAATGAGGASHASRPPGSRRRRRPAAAAAAVGCSRRVQPPYLAHAAAGAGLAAGAGDPSRAVAVWGSRGRRHSGIVCGSDAAEHAGARPQRDGGGRPRGGGGEGHAAGAANDARSVALGRAVATRRSAPPLSRGGGGGGGGGFARAALRRRRRRCRTRGISHRIWLCGDATFVSPLNIDARISLHTLGCRRRSPRAPPPPPPPSTPSSRRVDRFSSSRRPRLAEVGAWTRRTLKCGGARHAPRRVRA